MGGGASGMGGVEQLLQTTIMIGKAISGVSFPGMHRIYDFHSELAPPLKNKAQFMFFGFEEDDDEEEKEQVTVDRAQYEHLFHVTVGEDVVYLEEPLCVNEAGWTPLHTCCMSMQTCAAAMALIDENIKRGGNLDIKTKQGPGTFNSGWTCLHIATAYGIEPIVERLVQAGANTNSTNSFGYSPLLEAAHRGFINIAKLLLQGGANLNLMPTKEDWAKSPFMSSPCHCALGDAARCGFTSMVELLITSGANVNQPNFLEWTPLHEACFYNRYDTVKLLLLNGADPTLRTGLDALPYHLATGYQIKDILVELGGDGAVPKEGDEVNMMEVLTTISMPQQYKEITVISSEMFSMDVNASNDMHDQGVVDDDDVSDVKDVDEDKEKLVHTGGLLGDLPGLTKRDKKPVMAHMAAEPKKSKPKKKTQVTSTDDAPKEFLCELSRKVMSDPVKSIYGKVFEKSAILSWFANQGRICPLTGMPLCESDLTPDEDLKLVIRKWILQRSMEKNSDPSFDAEAKIRSKPSLGSATVERFGSPNAIEDNLYDF